MKRTALILLIACSFAVGQNRKRVDLPSSKVLLAPTPGNPQPVDSLQTAAVLSPDQRYLVLLNSGYGTQAGKLRQGMTVVDTTTNEARFFPDDRLHRKLLQTYYLGLAFSSDGTRVFASIGSLTDPLATKSGSLGNGIAVYRFDNGAITPDRFLKIPPQPLAGGKKRARATKEAPPGTVPPFPAGIAV